MLKVFSLLVLTAMVTPSSLIAAIKTPSLPAPTNGAPGASLTINPKEFGPLSTIELKFGTSMIPKEKVGSVAEESPLSITPDLPGKFEWTSTRTGIYRLDQAPKFDSSYYFNLRKGLKDVDGKELPAGKLKDCMTEKFRIVEQHPRWFDDENLSRTQKFLFEFNDDVALETVASAFKFKCAEGKQVIDAKARLATGKDFKTYYSDPHQTWNEQVAGVQPRLKPDDVRECAVVLEPVTPLNPGKDWVLDVVPTVVNKINTSKLDTGDNIQLGTVIPFAIEGIFARTPFDAKPRIDIDFNKDIGTEEALPLKPDGTVDRSSVAPKAGVFVAIDPPVSDVKYSLTEDNTLSVSGSFALEKEYKVTVAPEIVSNDGLKLVEAASEVLVFKPNPPYIAAPGFVNAQMATGKGEFEFSAANVTQVRMRAKRMTGPQLLQAIEEYETYKNANGGSREERAKFKPKAFDEWPGTLVFERTFPMKAALDSSSLTKINWKEVLGDNGAAPLFIELEGTAMAHVEGKSTIAQTIVEFTDIGLFQKDDFRSSTVLAVSLGSGKPLPKVVVTLVDKEHRLLGHGETDANGMVTIPAEKVAYVLAEHGSDCTAMRASEYESMVPLWHFNVPTAWNSPWKDKRKTFMFAERPLFKPGETAHFEGLHPHRRG